MNRVCLSDGSTLEVLGNTKILERVLIVRRCLHCGEVTFWDDYEDTIKDKTQKTLKVTL